MHTRPRPSVCWIVGYVAVVFALAAPAAASAAGNVQATPIGDPIWKPADMNLFAAPIGTAATGYAEFVETMTKVLPPPYHRFDPALGIGPGDPHPWPYNHEIRRGLKSLSMQRGGQFGVGDFTNGSGVWLAYMVVPRTRGSAPKGSSPDFELGPIIPNALFPIQVTGVSERFGRPFNADLADFSVPSLTESLNPRFDVDGHSHFPVFLADNADFGPAGAGPSGTYEWMITMLDQTGSGWAITVRFVVRGSG